MRTSSINLTPATKSLSTRHNERHHFRRAIRPTISVISTRGAFVPIPNYYYKPPNRVSQPSDISDTDMCAEPAW